MDEKILALAKGSYLLLSWLAIATEISVGRLGTFEFLPGWYGYTGSALGPGGITARLARHIRPEKRLHWHIDYLLKRAVPERSWSTESAVRLECAWAEAMLQLPAARIAVPGFGASDCGCPGHLVYLTERPPDRQISDALRSTTVRHTNLPSESTMWCHAYDCSVRWISRPLCAHAASTSTSSPPETSE